MEHHHLTPGRVCEEHEGRKEGGKEGGVKVGGREGRKLLQTVHGILQESYEILASRHQVIDLECSQARTCTIATVNELTEAPPQSTFTCVIRPTQ